MDINLLTDVRINKFTKDDNGTIAYSVDGITWGSTIPVNTTPSFITDLTLDYSINETNEYRSYSLVIEFTEQQSIFGIDFNFTVSTYPSINYQYSFDGVNYLDFEYFQLTKCNILSTDPNYDTYIQLFNNYKDTIFKKHVSGLNILYTIDDITPIPYNEYTDLKYIIEHSEQSQVFQISKNNTIVYLYEAYTPKYLKINLDGMIATSITPFKFLNLNIVSTINLLNLNKIYDVSFITTHLFRQSYFDEYNFIPSITNSFIKMLSYDRDKDV